MSTERTRRTTRDLAEPELCESPARPAERWGMMLSCTRSMIVVCGAFAAALFAAPAANAQSPRTYAPQTAEVVVLHPTAFALTDADGRLITEWIDLPQSALAGGGSCGTIPCFDGAEYDAEIGALVGAGSCIPGANPSVRRLLDIGNDGNRANDCIPLWSQGFSVAPSSAGALAETAVVAFYWYVGGVTCISNGGTPDNGLDDEVIPSAEPCLLRLSTGEGYGDCLGGAADPAGGQPLYTSIVFRLPNNFDRNGDQDTTDLFDGLKSSIVDCRNSTRIYLAVINLCGAPAFRMPLDGSGHFTVSLLSLDPNDLSGQTLVHATCGAPFVWGPDEAAENRAGSVSASGWLDMNNTGVLESNGECLNLAFNSCPNPFSPAVSFLRRPDQDFDGVPDAIDNCPTTPNPGQSDEDHDGTGDACDGCPGDPHKIVPGVCGCGVTEDLSDTDEDGVPACLDQCPDADDNADNDENGVPDCLEGCNGFLTGDADGSNRVDNFDIEYFVLAVVEPAAYKSMFGHRAWKCRNDINHDGTVNNFDIDWFIQCLLDGRTQGCYVD